MFKLKSKNLTYLSVVILLLIFLSIVIPALRAPFQNLFKFPLIVLKFVTHEAGGIIFYHRNMVNNEKLASEVGLLQNKLNSFRELYFENTRLKKLLSFKQKSPLKLTAAKVIAHAPDSWSSCVMIDKGRNSGVKRGMIAINYIGLVGRVVEVAEYSSKVLLITDPNLGVSAIVQRSRQEGLVSGTLGSNLVMRYLPEDADIRLKDVVVTSGLNDIYPKGLLIGEVIDIGKELFSLSHYAIIRPAVSLANIEEVLLVIP